MKTKKVKKYNLIEIILAISVLAVGVTAVLSLFTTGMDQNKKMSSNYYASLSAENMIDFIKTEKILNWSETNFPNSPATAPDINNWRKNIDSNPDTGLGVEIYNLDVDPSDNKHRGVYGLKTITDKNGDLDITEFKAIAKIWKSDAEMPNNLEGVFLEISWPVKADESNRETTTYYTEIYNYSN